MQFLRPSACAARAVEMMLGRWSFAAVAMHSLRCSRCHDASSVPAVASTCDAALAVAIYAVSLPTLRRSDV